ncbi:SDR family NAD(P)-dependent oxidoreductase [Nostoc sp. 'Lobaria pulmonaria (5183) cyanobiont']|uniref:SDR family NAD(P)-dependent oxidoreductase n=1 Tax=Nostoc sp. 'Lobaria pulmonaria (5183) cyanobiont' TaxID=1618022 RepID=UPI001F25D43D|nr:SDR family NAD(P)-dependent oxidoreductase [Nostoc sp. 'Lobaria pulmonaria (5183) cyanobiont']
MVAQSRAAFCRREQKVCAVDNRTEALNQLVVDLGSPDALLAIEADVSSESNCKNLSEQVQQTWGAVDIMVNNAGNCQKVWSGSVPARLS